jgi:hypothetical protein
LEKLHLSLPLDPIENVTALFALGGGSDLDNFFCQILTKEDHLMSQRELGNVKFLLNIFQCPELKFFMTSICFFAFIDIDLEPLCFVEIHAMTLEQIIVPQLRYEPLQQYDEDNAVILRLPKPEIRLEIAPQNLTSLFVSKIVDRDPTKRFWKESQT